jgi:hypothetical protein
VAIGLLEAGAAPTTFFGVMLDITEQKQTEQTLRDAHQPKGRIPGDACA